MEKKTRVSVIGLAMVVFVVMGCAPVTTKVRIEDRFLNTYKEQRQISTEPTVEIKSQEVVGNSVRLELIQAHLCHDVESKIFRRTRHVTRETYKTAWYAHPVVMEFGFAGLLGTTGIPTYLTAGDLAAKEKNDKTGEPEPGNPVTYQVTGIALTGTSVILLVAGIIDSIRLRDSTLDMGIMKGPETAVPVACYTQPVDHTPVFLRLANGKLLPGNTNSRGVVQFSLQDVPPRILRNGSDLGTLFAQNESFSFPVILAPAEKRKLASVLGKQVVAVFDVTDDTGQFGEKVLVPLTNYLGAALLNTGIFKTIPRDHLRSQILEEKKDSYKECVDVACQIELGKALSAQKSVGTQLLRVGDRCVVMTNLYDLKTETVEKAAKVMTKCSVSALLQAMDGIAEQLSN